MALGQERDRVEIPVEREERLEDMPHGYGRYDRRAPVRIQGRWLANRRDLEQAPESRLLARRLRIDRSDSPNKARRVSAAVGQALRSPIMRMVTSVADGWRGV